MALEIKSKDGKVKKCIYDTEPMKESTKPFLYDTPNDATLNESYRKKRLNETIKR